MNQYRGKRINVFSISGERISGVCVGAADDIVKIKVDGEPDTRVVFTRNIFYYYVDGMGDDSGISGLRLFVCRCDGVCPGRKLLSDKNITLDDIGCENPGRREMGCDFGCVGCIENIPAKVMRPLLSGMAKAEKIGARKNG